MPAILLPTLFGLEAPTSRAVERFIDQGDRVVVQDGQVRIEPADPGTAALLTARCNVFLGTAERVLLEVASFRAVTFDALYDQARLLPWEDWIPHGWAFIVDGYSRKSKLFGIPACQSLIKKAAVDRLLESGRPIADGRLLEQSEMGQLKVQFGIVADQVSIAFDTSGTGLHKRGYRPLRTRAPLRETLAAAVLELSRAGTFADESLYDPMCGSGTFLIEAARGLAGIAPGTQRRFAGEMWPFLGSQAFGAAREEARQKQTAMAHSIRKRPRLLGSDIDPAAIRSACENAERAGVSEWITFFVADIRRQTPEQIREHTGDRCLVICNPPYGERLENADHAQLLQQNLIRLFFEHGWPRPGYRLSILTATPGLEAAAGRPADKRRKLYNGKIICTLYQYFKQRRVPM